MPEIKVPMHFGQDLEMPIKSHLRDTSTYLSLFEAATNDQICGESSPFYLYSKSAAAEIRAFDPDARIIIMLRNPVDMMYSMHARNLLDGNEDRRDFEEALGLEEFRKQGRSIPRSAHFPQGLFYRDLARFHEQVKRFKANFPDEQLLVILMEDIKRDARDAFITVLRFLEIDTEFGGDIEKANKSVSVRSMAITEFLKAPPALFEMMPARFRNAIRWRLNHWNLDGESIRPIRVDLRTRLLMEFRDDVSSLGNLINRDLSYWSC
jgi:hypothetical protein